MPDKRETIDKKYQWILEDIYRTDAEWEAEFKTLSELIPSLAPLKETFTTDADHLYDAFEDD